MPTPPSKSSDDSSNFVQVMDPERSEQPQSLPKSLPKNIRFKKNLPKPPPLPRKHITSTSSSSVRLDQILNFAATDNHQALGDANTQVAVGDERPGPIASLIGHGAEPMVAPNGFVPIDVYKRDLASVHAEMERMKEMVSQPIAQPTFQLPLPRQIAVDSASISVETLLANLVYTQALHQQQQGQRIYSHLRTPSQIGQVNWIISS